MDIAPTTHLSLCSGYGGIDLGLRRAIPNLRAVAYAEIEAFAVETLLARMEGGQLDPAPIWPDLKSFPWESFRDKVDILSGGYPCQPFSGAGKRLGTEDPRHLWPFIADGIRILRPKLCFFENVEGHISLGLREVIGELESIGYKTAWGIFSAAEVGAPHQRKRVFILAYRIGEGSQGWLRKWQDAQWQGVDGHAGCGGAGVSGDGNSWPSRPGEPQHGWEPPRVVGNASNVAAGGITGNLGGSQGEESGEAQQREWDGDSVGYASEVLGNAEEQGCGRLDDEQGRLQESEGGSPSVANHLCRGLQDTANKQRYNGTDNHAGIGTRPTESSRRQTQPTLGGNFNEPPRGLDYAQLCLTCDNRTDELRLLGNGVVPATATLAFETLLDELLK